MQCNDNVVKPIVKTTVSYNWTEISRLVKEKTGTAYGNLYLYQVWTGSCKSKKLQSVINSIIGKHIKTKKVVAL